MLCRVLNSEHNSVNLLCKLFVCDARVRVLLVNTARNMKFCRLLENGTRNIAAEADYNIGRKITNYFFTLLLGFDKFEYCFDICDNRLWRKRAFKSVNLNCFKGKSCIRNKA